MSEERMFKVTVEGQYYTLKKDIKLYREEFLLTSPDSALSIIKGKLLLDRLVSTYPDCKTYRTHRLVKMEAVGTQVDVSVGNIPIESQTYPQLVQYCLLRKLQIDPYKHKTLDEARAHVLKAWGDECVRIQNNKEVQAEEDKENELRRLNGLPPKSGGVVISEPTPIPPAADLAPASSPHSSDEKIQNSEVAQPPTSDNNLSSDEEKANDAPDPGLPDVTSPTGAVHGSEPAPDAPPTGKLPSEDLPPFEPDGDKISKTSDAPDAPDGKPDSGIGDL